MDLLYNFEVIYCDNFANFNYFIELLLILIFQICFADESNWYCLLRVGGGRGLTHALDRICEEACQAAVDGYTLVVLSDRFGWT